MLITVTDLVNHEGEPQCVLIIIFISGFQVDGITLKSPLDYTTCPLTIQYFTVMLVFISHRLRKVKMGDEVPSECQVGEGMIL